MFHSSVISDLLNRTISYFCPMNQIKGKALSFGFVVGTASLAFVVSQLDVSIVNIALPQISKSLSAGVSS